MLILLLTSCRDQDEIYPAEPQIEFVNIAFEDNSNPYPDDLSITFSITDGDMDFGLDYGNKAHFESPYHDLFYYSKKDGTRITSDKLTRGEVSLEDLIQFNDRVNPPFDTLPGRESCKYFFYDTSTELYCDVNENAYNLFVKIYLQEADGSFVEYDMFKELCYSFNTRVLSIHNLPNDEIQTSGPFSITMKSARRGQITYNMKSRIFDTMQSRKMKLQIYVKDRALNTSNVVETPEFVLDDI